MKTLAISFVVWLAASLSCKAQTTHTNISPSEFKRMMHAPGTVLLDVRTPAEWQRGAVKAALRIDWMEEKQFKAAAAKLDKSKTYLLYCGSGGRAEYAAEYMHSIGFSKLYVLQGGFRNLQQLGLPVE